MYAFQRTRRSYLCFEDALHTEALHFNIKIDLMNLILSYEHSMILGWFDALSRATS